LPPLKFWWYDGSPGDKTTPALRPHGDTIKEIVAMNQGGGQGGNEGQRRRNRDQQQAGGLPPSGALIIGDKGQVYSPDDYGLQFFVKTNDDKTFVPGDKHEAAKAVPVTIPRAPGPKEAEIDEKQKIEWVRMIKDGTPSYSNFDIAAYLTEIILLGCIAMKVGVKNRMQWDGPNMRSTNVSEAAQFVRRQNRKGWEDPTAVS